MLSSGDERALVGVALDAAQFAHAPYSKFRVGAALLTAEGSMVSGCNVENASYGLTVCAERVATWKAVSQGARSFLALAVCSPGGAMPCGACRQVLREFGAELPILVCDQKAQVVARRTLQELLPDSFEAGQIHNL